MNMQSIKRKILAAAALLPSVFMSYRSANAMGTRPPAVQLSPAQQRFKDIGLGLVVDAVEGAEMLGVEFFADDKDLPFYAKSRMVKTNREIMSFPSGIVPERVRVIWRDSTKIVGRKDNPSINTYAGNVLGDYTVLVASRIPDEVVKEIRTNGGGLRLKFRLKPDGVMFGWDIERFSGGLPRHSMAGGDFLQTWY
jgi:hypothetical protein